MHYVNQICSCFCWTFFCCGFIRSSCWIRMIYLIILRDASLTCSGVSEIILKTMDKIDRCQHYNDVVMGTIASRITSLTIVSSTVYSDADQRKHQSSASLAFVWGIHRGPVNSPYKWPVTRKSLHLMTSSWNYNKQNSTKINRVTLLMQHFGKDSLA